MQRYASTVYAVVVCLSVTLRYCIKTILNLGIPIHISVMRHAVTLP